MTRPLARLGTLDVPHFMRRYWQRRPLLIRGALPGFAAPIGRARLFALAERDDVESRLVVRRAGRWTLREGPFARRTLPPLSQRRWTLLVQGVDLVDARARELLSRFRFVPDARLDDLMASYASDGGGVGPHVDNYDVFLLQAEGRRRWRISRQRDHRLQEGAPLKLLRDFRPTREWVLAPGDLLYLPPGVAHEGIAEGEGITYSIGFRAPAFGELLDPWLASFAERARVAGRYADPGLRPAAHPGEVPAAMVDRVHRALRRTRPGRADTERFLLAHLSEPKPHVVFRRPRRPFPRARFAAAARRRGVVLDLRSRMLSGSSLAAFNGDLVEADRGLLPGLRALADGRGLDAAVLRRSPAPLMALLHEWYAAGWLHLA